jgi:hypothetical protein
MKLKDENKQNNHHKLFLFEVGSHVLFRSFRIHKNMSVKSVIEKLQIIARDKEALGK